MKKIVTLILILLSQISFAQFNLVPNSSFEQFSPCPNFSGQIIRAINWNNPLWVSSPDYFNSCDTVPNSFVGVPQNYLGYEPAHSGNAYAGVITYHQNLAGPTNGREYIQTELSDSLITGVVYCIRFFVSAGDSCNYISNNIGIYFSPVEIHDTCNPNPCNLIYIPQFENPSNNNLNSRNGWTEISGSYTAIGGEKFIIIGNFRGVTSTIATYTGWGPPGASWALYYIDDVLITPCDSLVGIEHHLNVSPNIVLSPSSGQNEINIKSKTEEIQQIKIFSAIGSIVFNSKNFNRSKTISVNISDLSDGIYIVSVITWTNKYNLKFIKN